MDGRKDTREKQVRHNTQGKEAIGKVMVERNIVFYSYFVFLSFNGETTIPNK